MNKMFPSGTHWVYKWWLNMKRSTFYFLFLYMIKNWTEVIMTLWN